MIALHSLLLLANITFYCFPYPYLRHIKIFSLNTVVRAVGFLLVLQVPDFNEELQNRPIELWSYNLDIKGI